MITMSQKVLVVQCVHCGDFAIITVNPMDYQSWQEGALIQDAMPYLSADEREMLISGTCDECWAAMYETDAVGFEDMY